MMRDTGIYRKLVRVYVLQLLFISVVTVLGVMAAAWVVEDVMIRTALENESEHFWAIKGANPEQATPNTDNLLGFLAPVDDLSQVPADLAAREPGFGRMQWKGREPIVYVVDRDEQRLYLIFDEQSVSDLSFYFGVVPLSLTLLVIYLSAWMAYRSSKKSLSPMVELANTVEHYDINLDDSGRTWQRFVGLGRNDEVGTLAQAFDEFTTRIRRLLERERAFTRDVSHEMRTPLAVLKGSLENLAVSSDNPQLRERSIERMQTTVNDMTGLIETFLLLAKEEHEKLPSETLAVDQIAPKIIEQINATHNADRHVVISLQVNRPLTVSAPALVVGVVLSNLVSNACHYTQQGLVDVIIDHNGFSVRDTGEGLSDEQLAKLLKPFQRFSQTQSGHGLGMDIVTRLCERYGWKLSVQSEAERGTTVRVDMG
ncbi:MAG: HAMP domain-containing histidine kinase [Gammaproteobacteria bacterium]|nr:HAMP domain-containing histidine kinase [Gammaproteobacteria bacterium]